MYKIDKPQMWVAAFLSVVAAPAFPIFALSMFFTGLGMHRGISWSLSIMIVVLSMCAASRLTSWYTNSRYPVLGCDCFVYLLKRADGTYKIGHTTDLLSRMREHEKDYGMSFRLTAAWKVPNRKGAERLALKMTHRFLHVEDRRKELRKMNAIQVLHFIITFSLRANYGKLN